jgi:hypothetical protein
MKTPGYVAVTYIFGHTYELPADPRFNFGTRNSGQAAGEEWRWTEKPMGRSPCLHLLFAVIAAPQPYRGLSSLVPSGRRSRSCGELSRSSLPRVPL